MTTAPAASWWPLCTVDTLRRQRLLGRTILGTPLLAVMTDDGQTGVLEDRCPHRHAPLSKGQCTGRGVRCPYHGWEFDPHGVCLAVPGYDQPLSTSPIANTVAHTIAHDLLWVSLSSPAPTETPTGPSPVGDVCDHFFMEGHVNASAVDIAENFLDGFHTHYVHAGWLRHAHQRQRVQVRTCVIADGVEARYEGERVQSGWISRWLERDRLWSAGRFRANAVAELEYRGKKGLNLLATMWLIPTTDQQVRVLLRLATRKAYMPARLKQALLKRVFGKIWEQDARILELAEHNKKLFVQLGRARAELNTPCDVLGPAIRAMLGGEPLPPDFDGRESEYWL